MNKQTYNNLKFYYEQNLEEITVKEIKKELIKLRVVRDINIFIFPKKNIKEIEKTAIKRINRYLSIVKNDITNINERKDFLIKEIIFQTENNKEICQKISKRKVEKLKKINGDIKIERVGF